MGLFKRDSGAYIVAFPADTHANSYTGLNHPEFVNDAGFGISLSKTSRWQWRSWCETWDEIHNLKKELGAKLVTVVMGDALDNNVHSNVQLLTTNDADIVRNAGMVFDRPRDMSDTFVVVRGTEAHAGGACGLEEILADDLDAYADEAMDTKSWWVFNRSIGGVKINAKHHPKTKGFLPHTCNSAASRESAYTALEFTQSGEAVPDVAVRAHVHYPADSGVVAQYKPRTFYCRAWQLTTSFGFRVGAGRYAMPVGTLVLVIRDGMVARVWDLYRDAPQRAIWKEL